MSYTGSKAQSGAGTTLSIGSTPVVVGEILKLTQSGKKNQSADVTNLQSTADEFIGTLLSPGTYALTLNRVAGDAGQAAMLTAFNALTIATFAITLAKTATQTTSGDKYAFTALVEDWNDISDVDAKNQIKTAGSLKVSGPITFTAGT